MSDESPVARLPGNMHQKKNRWWWRVQLPGESKPKDRALRPKRSRFGTTDRPVAEEVAFQMWQTAIRTETEARVKAEAAQKISRLEMQFLEKTRAFTQIVADAEARAEEQAKARADLEAKLSEILGHSVGQASCECCGARDICVNDLYRIDSGQLLCPDCLRELRTYSRQDDVSEICRVRFRHQ